MVNQTENHDNRETEEVPKPELLLNDTKLKADDDSGTSNGTRPETSVTVADDGKDSPENGDGPNKKGKTVSRIKPITGAPAPGDEEFDEAEFKEMADLYEESFREIEENSIVKGIIVSVTKEDVLVDVGYKSEGTINLGEFPDRDKLKPGDEIEVYLESKEDQDGVIVLSKEKADFFRTWDKVREVYDDEGIISGTILNKVRGGFVVDIGVKAFLPSSQLDVRPVRDFDQFIGNEFEFKVIKINKRRRNIVLSRKALLVEQRKGQREALLAKMKKGLVLEGEVKNLTEFGAFIDLGGMDGLLHITDISWGRVNHPSEALDIGQVVEIVVLDFDEVNERVSLGLKQLSSHPWEDIHSKYNEDDKVIGKVVSIVDYGAFIELETGIEGLIHISEMSWTQRIKHPSKLLTPGDNVEAIILKIDKENQRISLGLRQTMDNPWESIEARFPSGTVFEGIVRNITEFGAFVELEEGIDGLVHISDMSWTRRIRHPSEFVQKNEGVKVVVLNVDKENQRISLGMKQLENDPWENIELLFPLGTYVEGELVRLTNYGAIVRLEGDIEGLLHISEIAGERITKVEDVLDIGDTIKVKVINVSPKERRINLSLWQYQRETGETGITKSDGSKVELMLEEDDDGVFEPGDEATDEGEGTSPDTDDTEQVPDVPSEEAASDEVPTDNGEDKPDDDLEDADEDDTDSEEAPADSGEDKPDDGLEDADEDDTDSEEAPADSGEDKPDDDSENADEGEADDDEK
ncbi:MAG: 30S ribosomal protein S1 [bacterium]|nr:30S ribosomal protein S1 [bacterium]